LATFDMKGYARRGAEMRVSEVKAELQAIFQAFPDLATGQRPGKRPPQSAASYTDDGQTIQPGEPVARKRRRRKMTAAERTAVGERMRKYWAARKAAAGAKKR
jgi:hypothetical protein